MLVRKYVGVIVTALSFEVAEEVWRVGRLSLVVLAQLLIVLLMLVVELALALRLVDSFGSCEDHVLRSLGRAEV